MAAVLPEWWPICRNGRPIYRNGLLSQCKSLDPGVIATLVQFRARFTLFLIRKGEESCQIGGIPCTEVEARPRIEQSADCRELFNSQKYGIRLFSPSNQGRVELALAPGIKTTGS